MYHIDGFLFEDETTAELAKKEEEAVSYIKGNTALDDIEGVYQLYTRLLEQKLFVTPVGIRFLTELQTILYNSEVPKETIPPIQAVFSSTQETAKGTDTSPAQTPQETGQTEPDIHVGTEADVLHTEAKVQVQQDEKEPKKKSSGKQTQPSRTNADSKYKKAFHVALFFAIVFGLSVAGMFIISEVSQNNINIINYRSEILNEYSTWEEELKEKEDMLREWEEELSEREAGFSENTAP